MFRGAVVVLAAAVALIAPATASAAAPGVAVRAESNVTFNSVFVNARIDPNNIRTTYFVRFGLTKLYGAGDRAPGGRRRAARRATSASRSPGWRRTRGTTTA